MMDEFPVKCNLCSESYSEMQLPRNLWCGHSVCTKCAEHRFAELSACPECQCKQPVDTDSNMPINYPIVRLIHSYDKGNMKLRNQEASCNAWDTKTLECEDAGLCPSHGDKMVFFCATCSTWVCRDCLVVDHREFPRGSCRVLSITEAMNQIKEEHKRRSEGVLCRVNSLKRKIGSDELNHDICLKYCRHDFRSHKRLVVEIDTDVETMKNKDKSVAKQSVEHLHQLKATVSKTTSPAEITSYCKELIDCQEHLKKHVQERKNEATPIRLKIMEHLKMDLRMMLGNQNEPMYAVLHDERRTRWAPIAPGKNGCHLHSLRDGSPPSIGTNIPFELLRDLIPSTDPTVFLELGIDNSLQGTVFVRLFPEKFLYRQTLALFLGEEGHSFRNTCFFKYEENQVLHGGDFACNDGSSSGKIFRGLGSCDLQEYPERNIRAGSFSVDPLYKNKLQFHLLRSESTTNSIIGRVCKGMRTLKSASQAEPLTKSGILDCGIFIPLK